MAELVVKDDVLGTLTWDAQDSWWRFEVGPIAGRPIRGKIIPDDGRAQLASALLGTIRDCVVWIRANEPTVREQITAKAFDWWLEGWYDEEIDAVNTPEGFRETIRLGGVNFYGDGNAEMCYEDGGLVGGHSLVVTLGPGGVFIDGPQLFG